MDIKKIHLAYFNSMLDNCASRGDDVGISWWLQAMLQQGIQLDKNSYNSIIDLYAERAEATAAEKWLNKMLAEGIEPDEITYWRFVRAWRVVNPSLKAASLRAYRCIIRACFRQQNQMCMRHWLQKLAAAYGDKIAHGLCKHLNISEYNLAADAPSLHYDISQDVPLHHCEDATAPSTSVEEPDLISELMGRSDKPVGSTVKKTWYKEQHNVDTRFCQESQVANASRIMTVGLPGLKGRLPGKEDQLLIPSLFDESTGISQTKAKGPAGLEDVLPASDFARRPFNTELRWATRAYPIEHCTDTTAE